VSILPSCSGQDLSKNENAGSNILPTSPQEVISLHKDGRDTTYPKIIERYLDNQPHFDFFDKNGELIKSIRKSKFIESVPNKYDLSYLQKNDDIETVEKGYFRIDKLNIKDKKTIVTRVLTTLPNEHVISSIQSISAYGPEALIHSDKFIVYQSSIYFKATNNWTAPALSETNAVIYNHSCEPIGSIVSDRLLEKLTLSDDGIFLLGEIPTFSMDEGGDYGMDGFNLFNVLTGQQIYHIPYVRTNGNAESIEYDNKLFKINVSTWNDDLGYWRFCIDPYNSKMYKKLYFPSDKEWENIKFLHFKSSKFPNGLEENLSTYEVVNF
jgi:hypothetical protein